MEQNRQKWQNRENWIDPVKGLIILWMVMYQASVRLSYGAAHDGWYFWVAEFGRPIRMPFLFLVSGMLLASSLKLDWKEFLNKRILRLVYLFALWTLFVILMRDVAKGLPLIEFPMLLLRSLVLDPPASLWFILALPIFLLVVRACRDVNPLLMLAIGLFLELLHIGPFLVVTDNTTRYFIYFLLGIYGGANIKTIAAFFEDKVSLAALFFIASFALSCSLVYLRIQNILFCVDLVICLRHRNKSNNADAEKGMKNALCSGNFFAISKAPSRCSKYCGQYSRYLT
jgi:uncharacterized membrane protein YcfT